MSSSTAPVIFIHMTLDMMPQPDAGDQGERARLWIDEPAGESLEVDHRPAAVRCDLPAARVQLHQLPCGLTGRIRVRVRVDIRGWD